MFLLLIKQPYLVSTSEYRLYEEVGIVYGTCQRVLTKESDMHLIAAKFVPRILTAD
jgi:hypothetical protein